MVLNFREQRRDMLPLGLMDEGEFADIVAYGGGRTDACQGRAEDMGLRVGKRIEVLRNGGAAVLVKVDESRIAVDRVMAMRIRVRRAE
jgi:ferrous iron transport protein A